MSATIPKTSGTWTGQALLRAVAPTRRCLRGAGGRGAGLPTWLAGSRGVALPAHGRSLRYRHLATLALAALRRPSRPQGDPKDSTPEEARRSLSASYKAKLQRRSQHNGSEACGFIDTHCHLDLILPRLKREHKGEALRAQERGLPPPPRLGPGFEGWLASLEGPESAFEGCINIGCSAESLDAAEAFLVHDQVRGAFGIHPLAAEGWSDEVEQRLWQLMGNEKVVAWGECGLDYFDKDTRRQSRDAKLRDLQRRVFSRQLELAASLGVPLVVHTRFAEEETLELMAEKLPPSHPVHVHCFTSSVGLAQELLGHFPRLCLGFTGVVTFRNAEDVRKVVRNTPLDRLLLETDGPYMAPEPHRGRVAHPGHVAYVAEGIAKTKGVPKEEVLMACRENTRVLYGF